jgi:hypothetical protein
MAGLVLRLAAPLAMMGTHRREPLQLGLPGWIRPGANASETAGFAR